MMRPRLFTYYVSALFLTMVWLHPIVTSISDDDGGNDVAPIGLQVWDTLASFNKALDDGRLILVMITAAWCDNNNDAMEDLVKQAADRIDEAFTSGELPFHPSSKPLIGVLPSETADQLILDGLGPITHYPALKFVLSTPHNCSANDGDGSTTDRTKIWNYIGPRETVHDVYDSVMMYWYRHVVSNHIYELSKRKQTTIATKSNIDSDHSNNKHHPPIFQFSSQTQMASFLEIHGEHFLQPAQARHHHESAFEKEMFEFYTGIQNDNSSIGGIFYPFHSPTGGGIQHNDQVFTQEIDPYILFVQCRSSKRKSDHSNEATRIFDKIAEEMMHRRDVAFFALEAGHSKSCGGWFPKSSDGTIAVLRVKRSVEYSILPIEETVTSDQPLFWNQRQKRFIRNITTDWNVAKQRIPHDLFIPSDYSNTEDLMSNLNKFIVIHTTPTVMWFDKSRVANLAFPKYRTTHAILFIDIGLGNELSKSSSSVRYTQHDWPENLRYSTETERLLLDQQMAIEMFYNAAIQYRSQRKDDDVVFLIIPSSETMILNTFGVDMWTPLDEALFGAVDEGIGDSDDYNTCKGESSQIMPIMVVTDASESTGKQSSRYYLCPNDIFASSDSIFEHGGAMKTFIDKVLDGTAMQFIRSEELKLEIEYIDNTSNVTVVTGNTFQNVVMDREDEHTMLFMKQSTCGHCKRFSIFWNEFQTIIEALNWSSVISVCKIDVSKNDVPHPQIDAWDLPSVYYFPAGSKENPIEMTPLYYDGSINAQYDYDEGLSWVTSGYDVVKWMMKQGKLDLELLASLDTNEASAIEGDASTSSI